MYVPLHCELQNLLYFKESALLFLYLCIQNATLSMKLYNLPKNCLGGGNCPIWYKRCITPPYFHRVHNATLCKLVDNGWILTHPTYCSLLPLRSSPCGIIKLISYLSRYSHVSSQSVARPPLQVKETISLMKTQSVDLKSRHQITREREKLIFTPSHVILFTTFISSPIDL